MNLLSAVLASILTLTLLCVSASGWAAARRPWVQFAGCRYVEQPYNDGDSFHVRCGEKEMVVRLYLVDAPETRLQHADRVREQAEYFGVTIDEALFAGFLTGSPVTMTKAVTCDLEVPANAEFVIEGYVDPGERRMEGDFGDHTGWYSLAEEFPVFHVTAVTSRRNPLYLSTIVGRPPMEDGWLGWATERLFLPLLQVPVPEVVDYHLPVAACFHNLVIVAIRKSYPGHARKVCQALWGTGQIMFSKIIVVVDEDVDVHDTTEVLWRVTGSIDPGRDVFFSEGPIDQLDHATNLACYGGKMGIDATRKLPGEKGFAREWPALVEMDPEVDRGVDERWASLLSHLKGPRP